MRRKIKTNVHWLEPWLPMNHQLQTRTLYCRTMDSNRASHGQWFNPQDSNIFHSWNFRRLLSHNFNLGSVLIVVNSQRLNTPPRARQDLVKRFPVDHVLNRVFVFRRKLFNPTKRAHRNAITTLSRNCLQGLIRTHSANHTHSSRLLQVHGPLCIQFLS